MLDQSAAAMARSIRAREISSVELVSLQLKHIERVNPGINAVVDLLADSALGSARACDARLASGQATGPLHGVPFSVKDSIDVEGVKTTAGTLGRRDAPAAVRDATLVRRLREAGAIPIAKTNLPDLLFSFESDNLIYGRTNNPYKLEHTAGGSSGGESALIAACGSPLGLGSDAFGSVRVPAAFCGIASIKPTSGGLPRTGHVPPPGGWLEAVWQIGPMSRCTEDLKLAMKVLSGQDGEDFHCHPVSLFEPDRTGLRIAVFDDNGFIPCDGPIRNAVRKCADFFAREGFEVKESRPPGVENAFELELAMAGADGADGIDEYLQYAGSTQVHPLLTGFLNRLRPFRASLSELVARWTEWDEYRAAMARYFHRFDAILCPVYPHCALMHGESMTADNFEGFSYTMAWNMAGLPAATVRCSEWEGLPVNVQIVTKPWRELLAIDLCRMIEEEFGGWKAPPTVG